MKAAKLAGVAAGIGTTVIGFTAAFTGTAQAQPTQPVPTTGDVNGANTIVVKNANALPGNLIKLPDGRYAIPVDIAPALPNPQPITATQAPYDTKTEVENSLDLSLDVAMRDLGSLAQKATGNRGETIKSVLEILEAARKLNLNTPADKVTLSVLLERLAELDIGDAAKAQVGKLKVCLEVNKVDEDLFRDFEKVLRESKFDSSREPIDIGKYVAYYGIAGLGLLFCVAFVVAVKEDFKGWY